MRTVYRRIEAPIPLGAAARLLGALTLACVLGALAAPAGATPVVWPGADEANGWLQKFEDNLQSHDSATAVLQDWCDAHALAPGARIVARQVQGVQKPPTALARQALRLGPKDKVRYRRVELACGGHVLSRADNWYLPQALTADMNRQLDQTQTPFGVVVKALGFRRRNLTSSFSFASAGAGPVAIPPEVLQHSALLYTAAGDPFSFVVETYTDQVLAFKPGP